MTEEHFDPPKGVDLDEFMKHSFKVMHDDLHTVKVRISPAWAGWVDFLARLAPLREGGLNLLRIFV